MKDIANYNIGLEQIDFQLKDSFGPDLEKVMYDSIAKVTNMEDIYSEVKLTMAKVIKERTGIFITLLPTPGLNAMVMPPNVIGKGTLSDGNFILDEMLASSLIDLDDPDTQELLQSDEVLEFIRNIKDDKIKVDTKKARIKGLYSNNPFPLMIGWGFYDYVWEVRDDEYELKSRVRQFVSVLLHEIGHIFTYIESSHHLTSQSMTMAAEVDKLRKNKDRGTGIVNTIVALKSTTSKEVYKEMLKVMDAGGNETFMSLKLVRLIIKDKLNDPKMQIATLTGRTGIVDPSETVADGFATRFGYGEDLIAITEYLKTIDKKLELSNSVIGAIMVGLLSATVTLSFIVGLFAGLTVISLILFQNLLSYFFPYGTLNYSNTNERNVKIRNALVVAIKEGEITSKNGSDAIETLDRINKLLKREEVLTISGSAKLLYKIFNPSTSKEIANVAMHRLIELMNTNQLFVSNLKLKTRIET